MNTQNILTVQLEQEDTSGTTLPRSEWEVLRDSACSTISQLKKIKLSVYKEKLNLYSEKCKIKDDVILALQTCLETYKNTNENNNDLLAFMKSKLAERNLNIEALKEAHRNQIAEYESRIIKKNKKIETQSEILKQSQKQVKDLQKKLLEINELSNKSNEQFFALNNTVEESFAKISERDNKIAHLEAEITKTGEKLRTTQELFLHKLQIDAALKFYKQNDRLIDSTTKELKEVLSGESRAEIKIVSLPRIGQINVAVQNVPTGSYWIVIQRRGLKLVDFNQGWFSFVEGFGNLDEDLWIGLEKIHAITKSQTHELFIYLVFADNDIRYAYYDNFAISGKSDDYKLRSLGNYIGNAGDGFRSHEHQIFRTIRYDTQNSVEYNRWWQHENPSCNLNGTFNVKSEFGVWWCRSNGNYRFLEAVQMLIRRKQA